nr:hypothetical protein Q903MT_gene242 [Picea sitchensis]
MRLLRQMFYRCPADLSFSGSKLHKTREDGFRTPSPYSVGGIAISCPRLYSSGSIDRNRVAP